LDFKNDFNINVKKSFHSSFLFLSNLNSNNDDFN